MMSRAGLRRLLRLPWSYTYAGGRDLRLDFLRGFALLVMFVDHLSVSDSPYYFITFRGEFYTTAAQGFFFISGYVLGMISARLTLSKALRRLSKRIAELYLAAIGMGIGFACLGWWTEWNLWTNSQASLAPASEALATIGRLIVLRKGFHGSEILITYVVVMILGLGAILLCFKRLGWLALLISAIIYAAGLLTPYHLPFPPYFYPPTYQLIFIAGLVGGFNRREPEHQPLPGAETGGKMVIAGKCVILVVFVFFTWLHATQYRLLPGLPELLGGAHTAPPLRLVLIGISLYSLYLLATWLWKPLHLIFGWLLLPLGMNSLWSLIAHLVIIVTVYLNFPGFDYQTTCWVGATLHTSFILLVWGTVKIQQLFPKGAWRKAAAAGMIGLLLWLPYLEHRLRP